jgi:hypothetical protein
MQIKKSQILLTVASSKKVADLIVSISVPFDGVCDGCLKKLKVNCGEPTALMAGSEKSALAYALYETVRDKLSGSALETFKTKVSNVECNVLDKHFVITFHTQSTGTSLRKTCGMALSCFNVSKLFAKYSENIKFLSGKGGNREEFNYACKSLLEGIKKSVIITAVGKFPASMDKDKLMDIVVVLVTKIPELEMPPAKETTAPPKRDNDAAETYPFIKSSGLSTAVVADYIRNNSNGMSVAVIDEGVVVYNMGFHAKHKQLKDTKRIEDYVEKKYGKLEVSGELSPLFAYYALSEGFINSDVASKVITEKIKTGKLIDLLKKTL